MASNEIGLSIGIDDRRSFILNVADTFAGTGHRDYWDALYAEIDNGGAEAMFCDLLAMDLTAFNVRAVPTAAKAQQQVLSLNGRLHVHGFTMSYRKEASGVRAGTVTADRRY